MIRSAPLLTVMVENHSVKYYPGTGSPEYGNINLASETENPKITPAAKHIRGYLRIYIIKTFAGRTMAEGRL